MLEYEIGGARDGWLNRMNFLSPLDEWEFLEKREPPLSLSLPLPPSNGIEVAITRVGFECIH